MTTMIKIRRTLKAAVMSAILLLPQLSFPVNGYAAETTDIGNIYSGMVCLYGRNAIITDGDSEGLTKIYEDTNANGILDDADILAELPDETGSKEGGYDLSNSTIYGLHSGTHNGDLQITMLGGCVKDIDGSLNANVKGDFNLTMTGGEITEMITSAGIADRTGSVNISIGGNAKVKDIYGGSLNGSHTIDGDVNITVSGNAEIGTDANSGISGGSQQSGDTITGKTTISVNGGIIHGSVFGDGFFETALNELEIAITDGTIEGTVRGLFTHGSTANSVKISLSGGTINNYNLVGLWNGTVNGDVELSINGGTTGANMIGSYKGVADNITINVTDGNHKGIVGLFDSASGADNISVNISGGSISGAVIANNGSSSWKNGTISVSGGTLSGAVCMRNGSVTAPETSRITVSGSPGFGPDGYIKLLDGEHITQTGKLEDGAAVRVMTYSDDEGTLIAVPEDGVTLNPDNFTVILPATLEQTTHDLIFGAAQDSGLNLYLGTKGVLSVGTETSGDLPQISTDLEEQQDSLFTEDDKESILHGLDVSYKLIMENADDTVSADTAESVENYVSDWEIAQYIDILMMKYTGSSEQSITEIPSEIEIVINIPDSLKKTGRIFSVLRTHENADGSLELTGLTDLDDSDDTVTIRTGKFSIYTLLYSDEQDTHFHTISDTYSHDENGHWKGCTVPNCDKKEEAPEPHIDADSDNICDVCEYEIPHSDNPGSDTPGTDNPGSDDPGTDNPGSDNPGSDDPGTDTPGSDNPGSDTPGSDNPGSDNPGSDNPGSDTPGSDNPGSDNPGSDNPGSDNPGSGDSDDPGSGDSDDPGSTSPITGDRVFPWATAAMISGLVYIAHMFLFKKSVLGMSEEQKSAIIEKLIRRAKGRGRLAKLLTLGLIAVILCYYHGIGKKLAYSLEDITESV